MNGKKINDKDVFDVYRKAYRLKIPFADILDREMNDWISVFEKATNCSKTLVLPSLLTLASTLCGPLTSTSTGDGSFSTSLNQFILSICAPGGGKSNTYTRVMQPVFEIIQSRHGKKIDIETYTTAGLQKHQSENAGYGIICGDEGHRFLTSVNVKQSKGEGERAFLCKMWQGRGDTSTLSTGERGFARTSMSCCIFIQPQPLLTELMAMGGDDGLMDRFIFIASKPVFNTTTTTKENMPLLAASRLQSFADLMNNIYEEHIAGKQYVLSEEAEVAYNNLVDSYAEYINKKYGSDEEDEEDDVSASQDEETGQLNSKATVHILRLATLLHVLQHHTHGALMGHVTPTPTNVPIKRLQQAMVLHNCLSQHKTVFLQAVDNKENDNCLKVKKVPTFRERVIKAVCKYPGPVCVVRQMQKNLKGSLAENIKIELEHLHQQGFGILKSVHSNGSKRHLFFKLPANLIDDEVGRHMDILKTASMSVDTYEATFSDVSKLSDDLTDLVIQHHPHIEVFRDLMYT